MPGRPSQPFAVGARRQAWWFSLASGLWLLLVLVGCQSKRYDVSVPVVEEYRIAPDEARYNTPPESGYRKPPPKKEFKPRVGGGPPGAGGMGGPGL